MKHPLILAAGLAVLAAGPALAGGTVTSTPAPVFLPSQPPVQFGKVWTGPSLGVQLGYADVTTSGVADLTGNDALLGLRAYYDFDFGDFILGGGLQYDQTNLDIGGVTTLKSVTRLGVRGGVDLTNDWIYGTAGWALAQTSDGDVGNSDGWFAGIGYEAMIGEATSLGAELLFHEFTDFDLAGLSARATTAAVSINFRF